MSGRKSRKLRLKVGDLISKSYAHINLTRYFIITEELDAGLYKCFSLDDNDYDTVDVDFAYERQSLVTIEKLA